MSDLDDYEQSERVRHWLASNWAAIVIGIAIGIGGIFGYRAWQERGLRVAAEAQGRYQALVKAIDEGKPADEIAALKAALQKDYGSTPYAVLAALREAQAAIRAGELDKADTALVRARAAADEPALAELVTLRLAEVRLARGEPKAALDLVDAVGNRAYRSAAAVVRADALAALGRREEARAAYDEALTAMDVGSPNRTLVEMKRDDVATAGTGS